MLGHGVFIRHLRLQNSSATTQNLRAKCPGRALAFHDNPPVTLQYSPATQIRNGNLEDSISHVKNYELIIRKYC